jgi:hypothetical protein
MNSEVQRYEPHEALSLIRAKLQAAKLEIRSHYRCDELAELDVTSPANPERGSMSINRDGFATWECMVAIGDDKGIRAIVDVMTNLFATAAPGETSSSEDQLPPALRQEM